MTQFRLVSDEHGLGLEDASSRQKPLRIDFTSPELSYRRKAGRAGKEALARATGSRPGLRVLDCTAGLGRDSFMLASFGCEVVLIERSPVLFALLEDALRRAADTEVSDIVGRMKLVKADAIDFLRDEDDVPDVIYLDPMFPPRSKSAKVRGEMQILQRFIGPDQDVEILVRAALDAPCRRIVLKRPAHGAVPVDVEPDFTIKGKASRFDVFLKPASAGKA